METYDILKLKVERLVKMLDNFEEMNENEFAHFISKLENISELLPVNSLEKETLNSYLNHINTMKFKKYGYIFKGSSIKGSEIIGKNDAEELVWKIRSFLY